MLTVNGVFRLRADIELLTIVDIGSAHSILGVAGAEGLSILAWLINVYLEVFAIQPGDLDVSISISDLVGIQFVKFIVDFGNNG